MTHSDKLHLVLTFKNLLAKVTIKRFKKIPRGGKKLESCCLGVAVATPWRRPGMAQKDRQ